MVSEDVGMDDLSFSSQITERMARFGLQSQSSAQDAAKAQAEADKARLRLNNAATALRQLGCTAPRVRRYDPNGDAAEEPAKTEQQPAEVKRQGPESVPFFGVQLRMGGGMTPSEMVRTLTSKAPSRRDTPQSTPGSSPDKRPAWDSVLHGPKPEREKRGGCTDDVAAVRVCGVGGSVAGCAPEASPAGGPQAGGAGGCGGRVKDLVSSASPIVKRPILAEDAGSGPGGHGGGGKRGQDQKGGGERSMLRALLGGGEGGARGKGAGRDDCLVVRLQPSGGRLYVGDRARASNRAWLSQSDLLEGRAVRCLREPASGSHAAYPEMRCVVYEVDDVLNEPILGYHTEEEGCLLEVAGLRRLQVKQVLDYIHKGVSCGEGVLVHCRHGANRSATVAAAYMMIYHKYSARDALELIASRGPSRRVCRQPGFTRQLLLLEAELGEARQSVDVRRWQDMPGDWDALIYEGSAGFASPFMSERLAAQMGQPDVAAVLEGDGGGGAVPGGGLVGGGVEEGAGGGLSCLGEVLDGQIWHKKLVSLERREGASRVLCIAPPPLSNGDSTLTDLVVSLRGASVAASGDKEACVGVPGRHVALRVNLGTRGERDAFVEVATEMALEREGEEGGGAGEGGGFEGGFARKAQLVVNEEDGEDEVWM